MSASNVRPDHVEILDLFVIGLGPAGVACALQAHRDGFRLLAVGDEPVGGLLRAARRLDNLPAEPGISGRQLAARMAEQLDERDVAITEGRVATVQRSNARAPFEIGLADGRHYRSRTLCLATGTRPRVWSMQTGARWLHRDARSLPADLTGAQVAIIGGGEAALDTALTVRDRGGEAHVLARGASMRSAAGLVEEAARAGIQMLLNTAVVTADGAAGDWTLRLAAERSLLVDELVVSIGRQAQDELIIDLCSKDYPRQVEQDDCPGLFTAGDVIRGRERYVATAMGDGQRAALLAGAYLAEHAVNC